MNLTFAGNDIAIGNSDVNYLFASAGSGSIDGRLGNDYLNAGSGTDKFRFSTALNGANNVDHVADFAHGVDDVLLLSSIFWAIGLVLDTGEFMIV